MNVTCCMQGFGEEILRERMAWKIKA